MLHDVVKNDQLCITFLSFILLLGNNFSIIVILIIYQMQHSQEVMGFCFLLNAHIFLMGANHEETWYCCKYWKLHTLRQHIHRRWFCANDKHCLCDGDGKQTQYKVAICQVKFHNFFIWSSWLKSTMTILAIWYSSYSRSGPRNSSLWCTMQCTNCSSRPPSTNRPYILPQCNLL